MIGWVDEQCLAWSRHKRWLMCGEPDAWPERSVLGKLIDEGAGAGQSSFVARIPIKDPPEAYTTISIALRKMADTHVMEVPLRVVWAHYLLEGKAKNKAPFLRISVPQYWQQLHAAHAFIVGAVPCETSSRQNIACA